jgi:SNF2 family DNA or RNA helicase
MSTTLRIKPPHILINCGIDDGHKTSQIGWNCKYDNRMKAFKAPFGAEVLIQIKKVFPHAIVTEGQEHVDSLKATAYGIELGKRMIGGVENIPPFDYDFKLTPFSHQRRGLYYLKFFNGAALFADCGAGKTAMTLWDIAMKYQEGKLRPSKVLVASKLMTLFSGWHEDTEEFTNLSSLVLWEPSKTKVEKKGEVQIVCDHGPKPKGKGRTLKRVEYYHHSGEPAILASSRKFNPRKHVAKQRQWKQVGDIKYGKETLTAIERINIRAENIKQKIASHDHDIHIINHEGLLLFERELTEREYDLIVIDESTVIKNPKSKVFQALMRIAKKTTYKRVLSGTPSPQGPQDLWSQFFFLDNGLTLGPDYDCFLSMHFDVITLGSHDAGTFSGKKICIIPHGKNGRTGTIEYVNSRLENRVFRCKLRDCVDLPPLRVQVKDVFLEDQQMKHYNSMKDDLFAEIDGERVDVTIDLAKIGKLRQITSGFILNREKEVKEVSKKNPKLQVLDSLLEEIHEEEKVVIFAIYRCEIEMLLQKFGDKAVAIYGGASDVKKMEAQTRFREDPSIKYIICQPRSAAYGVNGLNKVSRYLIFYSIDYSADTNYQAIKRIERTGQERDMIVFYLIAKGTIDEVIYSAIATKDKVQQKTIDVEIFKNLKGE